MWRVQHGATSHCSVATLQWPVAPCGPVGCPRELLGYKSGVQHAGKSIQYAGLLQAPVQKSVASSHTPKGAAKHLARIYTTRCVHNPCLDDVDTHTAMQAAPPPPLGPPRAPPLPQQPQPGQPIQPVAKRRVCAEVCLELLVNETARLCTDLGPGYAQTALDAIGARVGRQLVERHTRDKHRLGDTLEIIKYICKEFWPYLFKKSIDNLRTNHRGVYVLQDNNFRWLQHIPPVPPVNPTQPADAATHEAALKLAARQLLLPCGIIKGALCHLGVACTVDADVSQAPKCAFTIRLL